MNERGEKDLSFYLSGFTSRGEQPSSTNHSNSINQPTQQWLIDGWNEWGWNEIDVVAFLLRSSIGGLWAVAPPMAPPRRANAEREKSNGINEMKASKQREWKNEDKRRQEWNEVSLLMEWSSAAASFGWMNERSRREKEIYFFWPAEWPSRNEKLVLNEGSGGASAKSNFHFIQFWFDERKLKLYYNSNWFNQWYGVNEEKSEWSELLMKLTEWVDWTAASHQQLFLFFSTQLFRMSWWKKRRALRLMRQLNSSTSSLFFINCVDWKEKKKGRVGCSLFWWVMAGLPAMAPPKREDSSKQPFRNQTVSEFNQLNLNEIVEWKTNLFGWNETIHEFNWIEWTGLQALAR